MISNEHTYEGRVGTWGIERAGRFVPGGFLAYIPVREKTPVQRPKAEYDPFGKTMVATGPLVHDLHFWFSTKCLDEETGLYYYGYRFYSPALGRWLNRDPVEERGGKNLYEFVLNSPPSYVDPDGQKPQRIMFDDENYEAWFEEFWFGPADWDNGGAGRGGSKADTPTVSATVDDCSEHSGCGKLSINKVSQVVRMWWSIVNIGSSENEQEHARLMFRGGFQPLKSFVRSKEKCYSTKAKASCWKGVVQSSAVSYYLALGNKAAAEADKGHSDYEAQMKLVEQNLQKAKDAFDKAVEKCNAM